jgi:hypothetical protein
VELDNHLIKRTTDARLSLTISRLVSFGEKEIPYERIVYDGLQYDAHKASLTHIVQPAQASRSTGQECRVGNNEFFVISR